MTNTEGNSVYELMLIIVNHQYDKYWRVDLNECEESFAFAFARINQPYDGLYHGLFHPLISIYGKIGDGGSYFLYYRNVQHQPQQLLQPERPRGVTESWVKKFLPRGEFHAGKWNLENSRGPCGKFWEKIKLCKKITQKAIVFPEKDKKKIKWCKNILKLTPVSSPWISMGSTAAMAHV